MPHIVPDSRVNPSGGYVLLQSLTLVFAFVSVHSKKKKKNTHGMPFSFVFFVLGLYVNSCFPFDNLDALFQFYL